jgi:C4-dicarboxylate-specific signal transduction histidine kinase
VYTTHLRRRRELEPRDRDAPRQSPARRTWSTAPAVVRLAAIGELSTYIAHEIRNPLVAISALPYAAAQQEPETRPRARRSASS